MAGKRQRGVKASRIKLTHFMSAAGIKSQAELARRIADIEGLDSEPKDLVNRIFRQNKVEHQSLERIANALNVDAYKLYLTHDDQALFAENQAVSASIPNTNTSTITPTQDKVARHWLVSNRTKIVLALTLITIILIISYWLKSANDSLLPSLSPTNNPDITSSLIYPSNQALYPLAHFLNELPAEQVPSNYRLAIVPQTLFSSFSLSPQSLDKFEVDSIIVLDSVVTGRYLSLFIKHYSLNGMRTLGVINLSYNEFKHSYGFISETIKQLLTEPAAITTTNTTTREFELIAKNITQARALSEQYFNHENLTKAEQLLAKLPQENAESLAIQCLNKVNIGWHTNEKHSFEQAKHLCECERLVLNNHHPMVSTTNAFRLFRNGQLKHAAHEYSAILAKYPNNIEAMLGQAQLSMQYYLQAPSERAESLSHAINLGQQATLLEVDYWKSYHLLSNFFYLAKQPMQALAVIKKLTSLVANQLTLANGALLSLCQAKLTDTKLYTEQVLALNPNSYIAYETLFFIYAYQNNPRQALASMEKAMAHFSQQGGLFMQWGQLADAHRWAGNTQQAITHYQTALVEFQQDKSKNQTTTHDIVYSLYFQAAIHQLQGVELTTNITDKLNQLAISDMPSSHQLKAAIIYHWLGKLAAMNKIKQSLIKTCPIYAQATDLITQ